MNLYKVGDRVVVKENHYHRDFDGPSVATVGGIAYVTEVLDHGCQLALDPDCDPDEHSYRSLFFRLDFFEPYKGDV